MDCDNKIICTCSFPCSRRGKCCECVAYHVKNGEIPGCFFSKDFEKIGDRSLTALIKDRNK